MQLWLIGAIIIMAIGIIFIQYGSVEDENLAKTDIKIITHCTEVENHLSKFKDIIGADYDGYRGHIYRVLSYSVHFLGGDESSLAVIGTALVYHDIGLWTDSTLAYIEPSCEKAKKEVYSKFSVKNLQLVDDIIFWHHKITKYTGEGAAIVEAVRKADWIDATQGVFTKGMPREHINKVSSAIPDSGFHKTLQDFGPRLHGNNIFRIVVDMLSILRL